MKAESKRYSELKAESRSIHKFTIRNKCLQLLSVIYDKWGGGLALEFARHPPGTLHTPWGAEVPEAAIDIAYAPPHTRARLVRDGRAGQEVFFRYESIAEDTAQCEALMQDIIALFPQVNTWLREGVAGPNVSPFSP